jgi:AraC-like DNA-binding protein
MIISRNHLDLNNRSVIEKLIIKAPHRFEAVFPNEACFTYFKEAQTLLSSPTEKLEVNSSESVLLNCGNYFIDFRKNASTGTCEVYAVHLYPDLLKEIYKNDIPSFIKESKAKQFAKKITNKRIIDHFINSLIFYFENPELVTAELLVLKIKELMLLLLQTDNSKTIEELISNIFTPRQANLNDIIQTHLFSDFSIAELAALAGRSISSFKREFQLLHNDTPANFIKEKRLDKAEELLKHSDYSISEICFQIGFNDTSHFTKTFKKRNKLSPLAFRKAKK